MVSLSKTLRMASAHAECTLFQSAMPSVDLLNNERDKARNCHHVSRHRLSNNMI